MPKKRSKIEKTYLDKEGHPTRAGVYLAFFDRRDLEPQEIDVYRYYVKGLCCFADDFDSAGTEVNDKYDCHVSVQFTGLVFIKRLRNFTKNGINQEAGRIANKKRRK